jgi:hypothetical protein
MKNKSSNDNTRVSVISKNSSDYPSSSPPTGRRPRKPKCYHLLPLCVEDLFFISETSAALLCITQDIVTTTRLETVFNICQQVRSRGVAGARWRVLNEGVDLLSYLTAMLEINQRMSVNFDNGIGMGKTRVECRKVEVCVCKSGSVSSETNKTWCINRTQPRDEVSCCHGLKRVLVYAICRCQFIR